MSVRWSSSAGPSPSLYREWQVAGLVFRRSRRLGRWSCETTEPRRRCGVAGFRTPFGALAGVLRMLREG